MIEVMEGLLKSILKWWHKRQYSESMMDGRIYGKFYVRYPDGQRSINMWYNTAKDYKELFGGDVKCTLDE